MKIEDITEDWILQEIEKLKYTYGLNKVVRYNLIREEIYETQSVAEHVTNMLILAHYFRELEDPERKMDMEKIVRMIIMHDMGEIVTGDIIMGLKEKIHEDREAQAILEVASCAPSFISREIKELYDEFENPQTLEGKFVKAIDKIEAPFWFINLPTHNMIKKVTSPEHRKKNEAKRREIYPILGFKFIERFAIVMDERAAQQGLYD
jgi:5'-deoxynucleotidase YfbR-like HD superfamily hydrolase